MNETFTHTHTHTHTRRKPWRRLALFLSFFIPLIGFLACKDDNFYEPTIGGTATEKVDFNTLPNQTQKRIFKRSYIIAIKKYNAVALTRDSEPFYTKYGQTDMLNSLMVNFDMENPKFIFVIPFKNQEIRNNLVLIGYFEGHKIIYRFYDKNKIDEYRAESNYPYFIDHLDAIFYQIANHNDIASRGYCDYQYEFEENCIAAFYSECHGWIFIRTCDDNGDGDWNWNGSEWEIPGVEVEAESNDPEEETDTGIFGNYELPDTEAENNDPWDEASTDEDVEYPYDEDVYDYDEDMNGGGGSSNSNNQETQTPCEKATAKVNDSTYNAKVQYIKTKLNLHHETGFSESTSHQFEELVVSPTDNRMDVPVSSTTIGYIHVHQNDWIENGTRQHVIQIFTPRDIIRLLVIAHFASENGTNLASIYAGLYCGEGDYMLKFTGNGGDVPSVAEIRAMQANLENYNTEYIDKLRDSKNLNLDFLKFMTDKMGIEGVSLYQINDNGTVKEIKQNSAGTDVTLVDCN